MKNSQKPRLLTGRLVGEFFVIVMGVLVALGVDDWRAYRADLELEAHLLERLEENLVADAADLAVAQIVMNLRYWLFSELTAAVEDGRAIRAFPDSLQPSAQVMATLQAAGRPEFGDDEPIPDLLKEPLFGHAGSPDFDQADDAFQEMISGGALRVIRDPDLRTAILAYYRTSMDMADNVRGLEGYHLDWVQMLLDVGITGMDGVTAEELAAVVRANPLLAVQLRHGLYQWDTQAGYLARIEGSLEQLQALLEPDRAS